MSRNELTTPRKTAVGGLVDRMPGTAARQLPPLQTRRLTGWLLFLGFALFGVLGTWAATASMQAAVVASGLFRAQGENMVVQHLEGGILREIAVKEGQMVKKGEVLARLDDTRATASLGILKNQLASALATEARLQAEAAESDSIVVPAELSTLIAETPSFAELLKTQGEVFLSGRSLDRGQVQILQDRVDQLSEQADGQRMRIASLQDQLALLQVELQDRDSLLEKGLATKPQVLALQRDEAALMGDISIAETQLQTTLQQVAEVEERKLQVRRDRLIKITEAREANAEVIFDARQRISAAQDVRERLTLRAPVSGRVMALRVNTLGEVIEPGAELLQLVPSEGPVVIEVRVHPGDINQVHEGGEARVRLTAYNYRTTPLVRGWVTHVSADTFKDPTTGAPFFRAEVVLDEAEMATLPEVETLMGMPAQVMIATGEQTLADYLLTPILGGMEVALSENE